MSDAPGSTLAGLRSYAQSATVRMHELESPGGTAVVVPAWGGRILFLGTGEANALWTSPDFRNNGLWPANYGGCRTWFSPEGGPKGIYFSSDWKNWQCPPAMDPGTYRIVGESGPGRIAMENMFEAVANDGTVYRLQMDRLVEVVPPAVRAAGVDCMSLRFTHSYCNLADKTIEQEIDLWHLVQVPPRGTILVPMNDRSEPPYRNYFEPIPGERVALAGSVLSVAIDGARRYKLGIPQTRTTGAIAYVRAADGRANLLLKRFAVEAQGVYADRPQADPFTNGDPVQLYNHMTGGAEGFGEIECHSPAVHLPPRARQDFSIALDLIAGPLHAVLAAAGEVLGMDLTGARLLGT